jgi:hypothetical protein
MPSTAGRRSSTASPWVLLTAAPDFYALDSRMAHTGRQARWAATQVPVVALDLWHVARGDKTQLHGMKQHPER